QLLGGQRQRCRTTQLTPLVTLKFDIRAALADPRHCSLLARRWASVYGLAHEHSTLGARRAQRAVTFYTVIVARLTLRGPSVLAILREHFLPRGGDLPGACRRGDPADAGAATRHGDGLHDVPEPGAVLELAVPPQQEHGLRREVRMHGVVREPLARFAHGRRTDQPLGHGLARRDDDGLADGELTPVVGEDDAAYLLFDAGERLGVHGVDPTSHPAVAVGRAHHGLCRDVQHGAPVDTHRVTYGIGDGVPSLGQ